MKEKREFQISNSELLLFEPAILLRDLLKCWYLIVVLAVVVGVVSYIISDQRYQPVYQTNATLVVTTRDSSSTVYSNLQSTQELTAVFTEVLNSSVLQKTIMDELGIGTFAGSITASAIEETNLLTLQATASDPRTAFLIMQAIIENHEIVTSEVVGNIVIEVLQPPQVPMAPANIPDMSRQIAKVMLGTVAAACVGIMMLSYFKDTVRSGKEAEKKLKCWCLGEVHHENKHKTFVEWFLRRKNSLLITDPSSSFRFAETMRKLRRRIEQYMNGGKVLMVTSVLENEGKSTIAVNLALSMAKKHKKVLLIDLDLRKPACYKILEQEPGEIGTSSVLRGEAEFTQAITKDSLSGLALMLESVKQKGINRLLLPKNAGELLKKARSQYDYVVVDTPPMSVAPDAEAIIEYVDATLLVVQQNRVHANALNKAIFALQKGKAKLLGCVLNNVYSSKLTSGHGRGYGYGYGYGKYGAYGRYRKNISRTVD